MSNLRNTIEGMLSEDYKERFRAEYWQLTDRANGLYRMIKKYEQGTLEFEPTCPIEVLKTQLQSMEHYQQDLLERAKIEKIDLGTFPDPLAGGWSRKEVLWMLACMRQMAEAAGSGAAFDAIGKDGIQKTVAEAAAKKAYGVCLGVTNVAGLFEISEKELTDYPMTDEDKQKMREMTKASKERNEAEHPDKQEFSNVMKELMNKMF